MENHDLYIRNVFEAVFDLPVRVLEYPFTDFDILNFGLRDELLKKDLPSHEELLQFFADIPTNHILCLKSSLEYTTILFRFSEPDATKLLYLGPFLEEHFSETNLAKFFRRAKLNESQSKWLVSYYQGLPIIPLQRILRVLTVILSRELPAFDPNNIVQHSFRPRYADTLRNYIDTELAFTQKYHEVLLETHRSFFQALRLGNLDTAFTVLPQYVADFHASQGLTLESLKRLLHDLNAECRMVLLSTAIPPYSIHQAWHKGSHRIQAEMNQEKLQGMANWLLSEYALLYKIYGYSDYSLIIRNVIQYIHNHMDSAISLKDVAIHFERNRSSLSRQFRQETGVSFTTFVQKVKIQASLQEVRHSNSSIQQIALSLGFEDQAYFTRVFRKYMNCSPGQYRRNLSQNNVTGSIEDEK